MTMTYPDRARFARQTENTRLPLWLRLAILSEALAVSGHARIPVGRLRRLDPTASPQHLSRAIAQAVDRGLLDPRSSARCLVLVGAGTGGCPVQHKGEA